VSLNPRLASVRFDSPPFYHKLCLTQFYPPLFRTPDCLRPSSFPRFLILFWLASSGDFCLNQRSSLSYQFASLHFQNVFNFSLLVLTIAPFFFFPSFRISSHLLFSDLFLPTVCIFDQDSFFPTGTPPFFLLLDTPPPLSSDSNLPPPRVAKWASPFLAKLSGNLLSDFFLYCLF